MANSKNSADGRQIELDKALSKIKKEFGTGAIMRMGESPNQNVDSISTGILSLDIALGIGGFPRGRVVEIFGAESSGKTTIALQTVAALQQAGGTAAYIDAENAMDPEYAKSLGVNIDSLLLSQPGTGEEGLQIADALVQSGAIDLIVVDSVAALVPKSEIEGDIGDSHVGLQARLMSQALRKLASSINKTNTVVIFINQLREKVGVMFGNPETTPGGRALKFYSSVRLRVSSGKQSKEGQDVVGRETKIKVVKNKVAPPFKTVDTLMSFGKGIEPIADMVNLAVDKDIVDKSGSWYSYGEERLGQGLNKTVANLRDKPEMVEEIKQKVREAYGIANDEESKNDDSGEDSKSTKSSDDKATTKKATKTSTKKDSGTKLDV
ncbi:recombinase RecA [Fructilactobacillus fructivorans]|uniref:Protein RecA n=1 Tax=Fructilactobacillus fructivorans TaxID=1614 RepID=A0A0C1M7R3_9LACO|nr:recombinase RecA [Fructilactobacillus fructivorans]KID42519.1 RecA protein [Fructilactobacillus fructivorans]MCT0151567.1 recombinase RecA [Fructilactobacillus fructivorans]MCT2868123.1 recombinase RecA [Fructilactobacillus fructivorans]MCT2868620.1 recombinase RecA [Fructilactobacillus fructivorans]MCT2873754.1 recombinase RecA [Fructilactobacillus fructivorans]